MSKRLSMGRHNNDGTRGLRISAPGNDVDSGRLLFDSNARFAQILFRAQIVMNKTYTTEVISFPGQPSFNIYNIYSSINFVFPYSLDFRPFCQITILDSYNGGTYGYFLGNSGGITVEYIPYFGSVDAYTFQRSSNPADLGQSIAGIAVYNLVADGST